MVVKLEAGIVLALDTAPLIYLIENHPDYGASVKWLLDVCDHLKVGLVTSMVTYIEVLTRPEQLKQFELAARYRAFLTNSRQLSLYPLNPQVADASVRFRAKYGFNTPDAIQLAVAQLCGARYFITNDAVLRKCKEVKVVMLEELDRPA